MLIQLVKIGTSHGSTMSWFIEIGVCASTNFILFKFDLFILYTSSILISSGTALQNYCEKGSEYYTSHVPKSLIQLFPHGQ